MFVIAKFRYARENSRRERVISMTNGMLDDSMNERFHIALITFVGILTAVFVTPFTVYRFVVGDYFVAVVDALIVIVAVATAAYTRLRRTTRIPGIVVSLFLTAGAAAVSYELGIDGAVWIFPVLMFTFYLCPPRLALVATVTALVAIALRELSAPTSVFTSTVQMFGFFSASLAAIVFSMLFSHRNLTQLNRALQWATKDALTGLENRRSLDYEMNVAVAAAQRHAIAYSLLIIDIDNFKPVNDELGHFEADRILQDFAALLRTSTRLEDRVFRYGGDEFVVLLPGTSLEGLKSATANLIAAIDTHYRDRRHKITASMGGSAYADRKSVDDWRRIADHCLYEAKELGGHRAIIATKTGRLSVEAVETPP